MAKRTINDAFFTYRNAEGVLIYAQRGETHDIPEGEDLDRGDKFGAFTASVGDEPVPPEGHLVDIKVEWQPDDFNRFVDAGTVKEITEKLSQVTPENQPRIARSLIEAESSRGKRVRSGLVDALQKVADGATLTPPPDDDDEQVDDGDADKLDDDGSQVTSLADFVATNTIDAVLESAGGDPERAKALRLAEEERGDKARKSLLEALAKIEG
jgi:hypothetical protein